MKKQKLNVDVVGADVVRKRVHASSYKMWLINKVKTMVPVALVLSLSPFFRWFVYRLSSISLPCSEPQKRDTAKEEEEETTKRWYTKPLIYPAKFFFFFFFWLLACDRKRASFLFKSGPFDAVIIIRKPSFPCPYGLW